MKKSKEEAYNELRKTYSDEELAESFIFSVEPSAEERAEFLRLRLERLKNMSEYELIASALFAFKLKIQDYLKRTRFANEFSFANQLREYVRLSGRSNTEIADNLDIHKTKLSRLINGREKPNTELMYRLEEHSGGEIPAHYWWRLHAKEPEHQLRTDFEKRSAEAGKVENPLKARA